MKRAKLFVWLLIAAMLLSLVPAAVADEKASDMPSGDALVTTAVNTEYDRAYIEETLNLANNAEQAWTYSGGAWVLSVVSAVAYPELPNQQGVSVAVPGAYVIGIDTDGDGVADVTAESSSGAVNGSLVIDYEASVTDEYGQTYTAATAPIILTTGAAGYGSANNSKASTSYCAYGFISVACGNRGKQDTATDAEGNTYYTGDAPSCLCDQKAAARFVKYNILLGNLPGCVDYLVTTGGSGGGAHASMFAATSNNPDFYDYQIEAGAVGVYKNEDGSYSTTVTIDGRDYEISDGAWGCVAYSAITSLAEADAGQAFEYYIDPTYEFSTEFQAQLAEYLAAAYMDYINEKNLTGDEAKLGFDLNGDGDMEDVIPLTIEYDSELYADTNGYGGTYLDLYLCEFTQNLQQYVDKLDYASGWTWFDETGEALSDEAVAAMSAQDKALAFVEGRYAKGSTGGGPGGAGGGPGGAGGSGGSDSSNYASYDEMVAEYVADIDEICAGDEYGKNIVQLYNPVNYIGAEGTENPTWTRIVMGAVEGDICMVCSLNLQLAWLDCGTDAVIEWQWDGGHVPSEILGDSLALYVDMMYGKYVSGVTSEKPAATPITTNGTAEEATGTDLSDWVSYEDGQISFTLADVMAYRNTGASKAVPGFDTIDYNQEDYVFGNSEQDARHWDTFLYDIFQDEEYASVLSELFAAGDSKSEGIPSGDDDAVKDDGLPEGDKPSDLPDGDKPDGLPEGDKPSDMP